MNEVDLNFLARQNAQILTELRDTRAALQATHFDMQSMRDELNEMREAMTVQTAMIGRLDGKLNRVTAEFQTVHQRLAEHGHRLAQLENP